MEFKILHKRTFIRQIHLISWSSLWSWKIKNTFNICGSSWWVSDFPRIQLDYSASNLKFTPNYTELLVYICTYIYFSTDTSFQTYLHENKPHGGGKQRAFNAIKYIAYTSRMLKFYFTIFTRALPSPLSVSVCVSRPLCLLPYDDGGKFFFYMQIFCWSSHARRQKREIKFRLKRIFSPLIDVLAGLTKRLTDNCEMK